MLAESRGPMNDLVVPLRSKRQKQAQALQKSRRLDLPDLEREADARAALQQAQRLFTSHARSGEQAISADPLPAE